MLSNLDLLNRDLVLLYPRTNVKSIDFAKIIKIFKIRRYINCEKPLKIFIRHKKTLQSKICKVKFISGINLY
nr:MAG TPA: hypothetical protein [Caudoviricetes sp.]